MANASRFDGVHRILVDTLGDSVDAVIIDFLCHSIAAEEGNVAELISPYLSDDYALRNICASLAATCGLPDGYLVHQSEPMRLSEAASTRVQNHLSTYVLSHSSIDNVETDSCYATSQMDDLPHDIITEEHDIMVHDACDDNSVTQTMVSQPSLPPWALKIFEDWQTELVHTVVTSNDVAVVIQTLRLSSRGLVAQLLKKLGDVVVAENLEVDLIIAGGEEFLYERLTRVMNTREAKQAVHAKHSVFRPVVESLKEHRYWNYWQRLQRGSREDQIMIQSFAGSPVEPLLRRALHPTRRSNVVVSYHVCCHKDVASVHRAVTQVMELEPGPPFRVVSVASVESPCRIRQNLIYVALSGQTPTFLCSVDFSWHGTAPSGHWHLNRTPSQDQVEHWGLRGSVFHGSWNMCPLWWLTIPEDTQFLEDPPRLRHLLPKNEPRPTVCA